MTDQAGLFVKFIVAGCPEKMNQEMDIASAQPSLALCRQPDRLDRVDGSSHPSLGVSCAARLRISLAGPGTSACPTSRQCGLTLG